MSASSAMPHGMNVFVTGTSSGFGQLIAATLAQAGHTVVATMRDPGGRNSDVAGQLEAVGDHLHILSCDVTDEQSVNQAVTRAEDLTGGLDVVVNNAGLGAGGHAEAFTVEQLHHMFDVNVYGVHRVNRAALPAMRARGRGLLVNISSIMGRIVIPWAGAYTATKWALEGLTESLRIELVGTGVDVVNIEPGGFLTGFGNRMVRAADTDRAASYGDLGDAPQKLWEGMMESLKSRGPDPQMVADAVREVLKLPHGERPFRVVVDPFSGGDHAETINRASAAVQLQLAQMMAGGTAEA